MQYRIITGSQRDLRRGISAVAWINLDNCHGLAAIDWSHHAVRSPEARVRIGRIAQRHFNLARHAKARVEFGGDPVDHRLQLAIGQIAARAFLDPVEQRHFGLLRVGGCCRWQ